jgi:hypothetical protein
MFNSVPPTRSPAIPYVASRPTSGLTATGLSRDYSIFISLLLAGNWLLVVDKQFNTLIYYYCCY